MNSDSTKWFDEKYADGKKPTLEDRAHLCRTELDIPFTDRARRKLENQLKDYLFKLKGKGNYSCALHTLVYEIVFGIMPASGIDVDKQREYRGLYHEVMKTHEDKITLSLNFEENPNSS